MTKNLHVQIYKSITPELEQAWKKLTEDKETFIQSYCEWIKPWVDVKGISEKLNIVTVYDNGLLIGLAPFILNKSAVGNTLHSLPIHFGDFITFISASGYRKDVLEKITPVFVDFQRLEFH